MHVHLDEFESADYQLDQEAPVIQPNDNLRIGLILLRDERNEVEYQINEKLQPE